MLKYCCVFSVLASIAFAGTDWPEYLGGPDRNHYSALDQINRSNVAKLQPAWEYHTGEPGQMQCNPIVVGGVLYGAGARSRVFAVDAATGAKRWEFDDVKTDASWNNFRGLVYWTDGQSRRVLCTFGPWLYALDADTGRPISTFGTNGRTSLKAGLGANSQLKWVISTTPGTVFENLIFMPLRVSEDADAARADIQAFDIRTGKLVWVFHTIPYPGEFGYDTWPKDAYKNINVGSANCWAGMAIDRKRGMLFVPTGSASPDFWGANKLGTDLFANCLLALDARTGKLIWHYQLVHHDLDDRDLPAPPNLVTVVHDGRKIDAVAQATKMGWVYLFDRETGKLLFPVHEVPVPPSPLPGEHASATQPMPDLPPPFSQQTLTAADINPRAHNHDELVAELARARTGVFPPFGTDETILFPGFDGGAEWGGAGADPDGILYVNANNIPWVASLSKVAAANPEQGPGERLFLQYCAVCHQADRSGHPASGYPDLRAVGTRLNRDQIATLVGSGRRMMPGFPQISGDGRASLANYLLGFEHPLPAAPEVARAPSGEAIAPADTVPGEPYRFNGYNKFLDDEGYPAVKPPWGTLTAVDLNTGQLRWQVPLGELKELTAKGVPPTGTQNYGGPVVTAGGLVIIAATNDQMIRAFDKDTGQVLWQHSLPASAFATPATYEVNGRQYVAVACGGEKLGPPAGDSYVAFALPESASK
ncbi:MAG TPA: PQQ-binding-like beta-propeller repeat protein [Opitutaceae bacterium]|jgi:quinoprotein glucose dehydrogenase